MILKHVALWPWFDPTANSPEIMSVSSWNLVLNVKTVTYINILLWRLPKTSPNKYFIISLCQIALSVYHNV